jgi:hypothetical protein
MVHSSMEELKLTAGRAEESHEEVQAVLAAS